MSFVSHAQNFEDVILWRALGHIANGFYLDIGAQDPVIDSVSLGFYENGWRGYHIEPTQQYAEKLRNARPDETVLQLALGQSEGLLDLFEVPNTGLSTSVEAIALKHGGKGFSARKTTVPVITLDTLLERLSDRDVHWMKIDVEGAEASVLEGWKNSPIRPWVLVIEATLPMSQDLAHHDWDHLVLSKGYKFVYFDGLNRFYVSEHHNELVKKFGSPANIFDDFLLSTEQHYCALSKNSLDEAVQRATTLEALAKRAEKQAQTAQVRMQIAEALASKNALRAINAEAALAETIQNHEHALHAMCASHSWRITAPLRWLSFQMQLLKKHGLKTRLSALARKFSQPNDPITPLKEHTSSTIIPVASEEDERSGLTTRARQIYKMVLASKLDSVPE